ncbi:MAG: DUF4388 domain-containing protein [Planctomycetes bacterium]|nr:DUF4388 domain-containing protein [Planctomycetota bacterium]
MDENETRQLGRIGVFGLSVQLEGSLQILESLGGRLQEVLMAEALEENEAALLLQDMSSISRRTLEQLTKMSRNLGLPEAEPNAPLRNEVKVPSSGMRGSSRAIPIPDLLALLGNLRKTGTLRMQSGQEKFLLEFLDGAVVHAVTNAPRPDQRLGTILVAEHIISAERLDEFLNQHDPGQGPIGAALARANLVSTTDLRHALSRQVRELFHRIFALGECLFYFVDGEAKNLEHRACLNTTQLLLESACQHDERSHD